MWPSGERSQSFWAWARSQEREGALWDRDVAKDNTDYARVLALLSGCDIIHRIGKSHARMFCPSEDSVLVCSGSWIEGPVLWIVLSDRLLAWAIAGQDEHVAPSLLSSQHQRLDARAYSDAASPFGLSATYEALPPGFFERIIVRCCPSILNAKP